MAGKSLGERMADTETRIRQLEAQKRLLARRVKEQARKERTRRLIQIGGIMARLGIDTLEKAQTLQHVAEVEPAVQNWLRKVAALVTPESPMGISTSDPEYWKRHKRVHAGVPSFVTNCLCTIQPVI